MSTQTSTQVCEFTSRHAPNIPMSLSRYKNKWYLVSKYTYGHLQGHRFFFQLNSTLAPTEHNIRDAIDRAEKKNDNPRLGFWSSEAGEYDPSGPVKPGSGIHIVLDSSSDSDEDQGGGGGGGGGLSPVAKLTGRMRSERVPSSKDGQAQEVVCYEVEVLIREEQLRRQCYYCLEFESSEEGGARYKPTGEEDVFWCQSCEKRGWATAAVTRVSQSLVKDTLLPTYGKFVTETVNPLIGRTPSVWAGNPYYRENIYRD